jgi:predicted nicotinamide N-methyase
VQSTQHGLVDVRPIPTDPAAGGPPAGLVRQAFGRKLALQRPPLCPEIALWLVAEEVDLEVECGALAEGEAPPYWAFCWGAGQALARFVLDHPEEVFGRRVVDFGAGSAVAGIAAALAGAASVTCVDIDIVAHEAARANAIANGVGAVTTSTNVPEDWDLLLASDVLYEAPAAARIRAATEKSRSALVAEPHRPGHEGYTSTPIARYAVCTFPDVDSPTTAASVYRF